MPRSYQPELLDQENIPTHDLYRNLHELNIINTYLGGHRISLAGLAYFTKKYKIKTVADVACGGGDNLIAMAKYARKHNLKIEFIGIDIKQDCINYAINNCKYYPEIRFIVSDYALVNEKFDIISAALFTHHLNENQLIQYLKWAKNHANIGIFNNDLERNFIARWSIKILTFLFSKSYLVKNDAPLSVARGFKKKEWKNLLSTHVQKYQVLNKWAFRHLVLIEN
jgi:SAM-dependent methyltransferase